MGRWAPATIALMAAGAAGAGCGSDRAGGDDRSTAPVVTEQHVMPVGPADAAVMSVGLDGPSAARYVGVEFTADPGLDARYVGYWNHCRLGCIGARLLDGEVRSRLARLHGRLPIELRPGEPRVLQFVLRPAGRAGAERLRRRCLAVRGLRLVEPSGRRIAARQPLGPFLVGIERLGATGRADCRLPGL